MILHENRLPEDDSHEISCLICYFWKSGKIFNCRLLQIIGGAIWVMCRSRKFRRYQNFYGNLFTCDFLGEVGSGPSLPLYPPMYVYPISTKHLTNWPTYCFIMWVNLFKNPYNLSFLIFQGTSTQFRQMLHLFLAGLLAITVQAQSENG